MRLLAGGLAVVLAAPASVAAAPAPEGEEPPRAGKRARKLDSGTQGNFGLGLFVGNPLALSAKLFLAPKHALQVGAGWAWLMNPRDTGSKFGTLFRGHLDYLWHPGAIASTARLDLLPYLGLGVGAGFFQTRLPSPDGERITRLRPIAFLRLPVLGLTFHWQSVPMDTFIEASWTPALAWATGAPRAFLGFADFGVGVRWYF